MTDHAKPIFTLVAYRRIAKFPDNQAKHADNSYEHREHKRDPHGGSLNYQDYFPIGTNTNTARVGGSVLI
jgi:hypothetical protein